MSRTEMFDVYETDADGNETTRFAYVTSRAQAELLATQVRTSRSTPAYVHVVPCAAPTREDGWRDLAPFLAALPALKSVEFAVWPKLDGDLNLWAASIVDFGAWMTALGVAMVVPGRQGSRSARGMWRGWMVDLCVAEPRPAKQAAQQPTEQADPESTAVAGEAGTDCIICGETDEECRVVIANTAHGCCSTCYSTDTHGTESARLQAREARRDTVRAALNDRIGTEDAYILYLPDLEPRSVDRGFRGSITQFTLQGGLVFWYDQDNADGPRWSSRDAMK